MDRNIDIIYFSLFRVDNPYSSVSFSLGKEFAHNNRVFYINHPFSLKDYYSKEWANQIASKPNLKKGETLFEELKDNFISVTPPLTIPINWLKDGAIYKKFKKVNEKKLKKVMQEIFDKYDVKDYIFINCFNPYFDNFIPENKQPKFNIYQCIDDMSQNDYMRKHGSALEDKLIKKADYNLVTSTELHRLKVEVNPNTHILHNAADISNFKMATNPDLIRPIEIEGISTKIIGFVGNLDAVRVDYELIKKVALKFENETILLVGPVNNTACDSLGITKLSNVIFTGSKKIHELPQYLKFMDVAMIPFKCNQLTRSIYPLKINEYLAAGKSVVSTSFSNDIRSFSNVIQVADDHQSFLECIERGIPMNSELHIEKRQTIAQTNTWEARVEQFWDILEKNPVNKSTV